VNQRQTDKMACIVEAFAPGARLVGQRSLTGGVSARTMRLDIAFPGGSHDRFVVRMHGARDLERDPQIAQHEYRLLEALWSAGLPVPKPIAVIESEDVLQVPAIVVEFVEGEIITAANPPSWMAREMARWLAQVHDFDLTAVDLSFLVPVEYGSEAHLGTRNDDSALARSIKTALESFLNIDQRNESVLLHGDFWRGNLLWRGETLVAIIDWEDAMVGDPILDLARSRVEIHWTQGVADRERFTEHYCSLREIDLRDLAYWDLVMALTLARAFPRWDLPTERESELEESLRQFVEEVMGERI
jgi:aminoglycoside phosphotransferase (APT) family kinase protein